MYLHKKQYDIRYTDVDMQDKLKLSSLLSFLEESACLSADELGFGYPALTPKNFGFILVNWYIEIYRPIKLSDKLTVTTWPIKPKKLIVFRDFELFCGEEKVGVATSRWCLVNLKDFSFVQTSEVFSPDMQYNDFRSVDYSFGKIEQIEDVEPSYKKVISYSDYDHYFHANNTKYGDLLLDAFSVDELCGKHVSTVCVAYAKQCKYGELFEVRKKFTGDGFWVCEGRVGGELRAQLKVKLSDD